MMRLHLSNLRRITFDCHCCSRCGPGRVKVICCAYRGRLTTARIYDCDSRKLAARVVIPVCAPLKAALDAAKKHGPIILTSTDKRPWTPDGFRASWGKACAKAGIIGVTLNDLRGTAVTRLALAQCTEAEIATLTGHSLRDVRTILDSHYLHRDRHLPRVQSGSSKWGTKTPD
jgi:integrase